MEKREREDRGTEGLSQVFQNKRRRKEKKLFLLVITKLNLRNKMTQYLLLIYLYSKNCPKL